MASLAGELVDEDTITYRIPETSGDTASECVQEPPSVVISMLELGEVMGGGM